MKLSYRSSNMEYQHEVMEYTRSTDFICPDCGGTHFRLWFGGTNQVDLTCVKCHTYIHITGITEDKNRD